MTGRKQVDLDPALHTYIRDEATKNSRTVPAEAEYRIFQTIPTTDAEKIRRNMDSSKKGGKGA